MVIQVALKNEANESASILDASVLPAHNDSIQRVNPVLRGYLGKYAQSGGMLTGSSPLMQVHLQDSKLLPGDARLITRSKLEIALSRSKEFLKGAFTDFGVALFTPGDSYKPNDLLAKTLAEQLRHKGISLDKAKLIYLIALSLQEDKTSDYGAVFKLNDRANKDNILDLDNFGWDYSRNEGLACAGLDWNRLWYASDRNVGRSYGGGMVAVVSGKATSRKILENHLTQYREERDAEIARVQREYAEREALLRVE